LDIGEIQRTNTRPRTADTTTDPGSDGTSSGVRTAALRPVAGDEAAVAEATTVGLGGTTGAALGIAEGEAPGLAVADGVIVLTARGEGVPTGAAVADAAATRSGGWLVPEFPFAASATAVTPIAVASTAPLTRPDLRIPIWDKRESPAVRIRLDG
jgi:hypothetical protein